MCEPVKVCFKLSSKGKLGMASEHRMQLLDVWVWHASENKKNFFLKKQQEIQDKSTIDFCTFEK